MVTQAAEAFTQGTGDDQLANSSRERIFRCCVNFAPLQTKQEKR